MECGRRFRRGYDLHNGALGDEAVAPAAPFLGPPWPRPVTASQRARLCGAGPQREDRPAGALDAIKDDEPFSPAQREALAQGFASGLRHASVDEVASARRPRP
jgi:hypothetical protein